MSRQVRPIKVRPLLSLVGMAGGLLTGLSVVVLLHQAEVLYPTRVVAIVGLLGGLLFGILLPTIVRARGIGKINRRFARPG